MKTSVRRIGLAGIALALAGVAVVPAVASATTESSLPRGTSAHIARVGKVTERPEFLGAFADFVVTYVAGKVVDYAVANSPALVAATEVTLAGLVQPTGSHVASQDAQFNAP